MFLHSSFSWMKNKINERSSIRFSVELGVNAETQINVVQMNR